MRLFNNVRRPAMALVVVFALLGVSAAFAWSVRAEPYEMSSVLPSIDASRAGAAYAQYDGKILVIGGYYSGLGTTSDTVQIYDISTGETVYGANMPHGGEAMAYAQVGAMVYVFGGYNSSVGTLGVAQVYDIVDDEWTVLSGDTPVPFSVATACYGHDGLIYVFGGYWSPNSTLVFDPVSETWRYGADTPFRFWATAAVPVSETAIYVIGGGDLVGGVALADVTVYNPVADTWTPVSSMPFPVGFPGATLARNGYIYVFGGVDSLYFNSLPSYSSILRYDIAEDEWAEADVSLSNARAFAGVVQDGYGRVFVVSGCSAGDVSAWVEMFLISGIDGFNQVVIVSPESGTTVTGTVVVEAALLNSYWYVMMGADFYVDGELHGSQTYVFSSWYFEWDTSALPEGSVHELMVRAYDWDGSVTEDSVTVTVSSMTVDEKIAMLEQSVADLSAELALLQETVDLQSADIAGLLDAVTALQAQIDDVMTEMEALSSDVSDLDQANADRIAALEAQLDSLETAFANLEGSLDDVQTSVDKKAENTMLYVIIGLLVVVIVLLLVMMVMGRKEAPPPPAQ